MDPKNFNLLLYLFIYLPTYLICVCVNMPQQIIGDQKTSCMSCFSSFAIWGQGLNLCRQAQWYVPLDTKPSCQANPEYFSLYFCSTLHLNPLDE